MNQKHVRDILIVLLILLIAKFGINYCYENNLFSISHIKYNFYVNSLEKIDSEELNLVINESYDEISIIYMGRESCPVCVELLPNIKAIFKKFDETTVNASTVQINQYYFDSEQNNDALGQQLRKQINATTVPVIILVKDGTVELFESDSLALVDYLEEFEKKLK